MQVCIAVILFSLILVNSACAGRIIEGIVKRVYDGDTVMMATRGDSKLKIRLYGIDAPETKKPHTSGQPYGDKSKKTLMLKIMGRQISAEIMDVDQYKRAVAILRYKSRDINAEMVEECMAWAYRQYLHTPYSSEYINRENRARTSRRGLWSDYNPTPPWEFRHMQKGNNTRRKQSKNWW